MKTNLMDLKAANTETEIVVTNIEKEFWAYAFRIAELASKCDDDCICDDCNFSEQEHCRTGADDCDCDWCIPDEGTPELVFVGHLKDDFEGVQDVSDCN